MIEDDDSMHTSEGRSEGEQLQHHQDHIHHIQHHHQNQHDDHHHHNHQQDQDHLQPMLSHMDGVLPHTDDHDHGHGNDHHHNNEYDLRPLGADEAPSSSDSGGSLMHMQQLPVQHLASVPATANRKRPAARPIHVCWGYFTDDPSPWLTKSAVCKHCHKVVMYWKKAQTVLGHLRGCQPFREMMDAQEDVVLVPDFVQEWEGLKRLKRAKLCAAENQKRYEEAFGYFHLPQKVLPHSSELLVKLLDEYGVETADDLRFLDEARRDELAKCFKFVPGRRFLELLDACRASV